MSTRIHSAVTRRRFLLGLGVSGGAALLAACSSPSAPAPQAALPTAVPKAAAPTTAPAAPAAAPNTAATDAAFKAEWDKIVATARGEKTVSIATYSGGGHRKVMEAFQTAFPGVQVEHQQFQSSSRDYVRRLLSELKGRCVHVGPGHHAGA